MQTRVLFIINPISGIGKNKSTEKIIRDEMGSYLWNCDIAYTKYKGHAYNLSREAAGFYDIVVAVGGDGTVNETGRALIGSETSLGIIPTGSGNGLARYLQIPFKINNALKALKEYELKEIDIIKINEFHSLNVSGIGFDAYISHKFAKKKNRGPLAYMQLISKKFPGYKSKTYKVTVDGIKQSWNAFLISFANSSQYGNNFYIAPNARIDDGLIDVCLIKDFPKVNAPALLISLLDQSIDKNKYDMILKADYITIEHEKEMQGHVDGEPVDLGKKAEVKIMPLALKVAAPPSHLRQSQNLFSPILNMLPDIREPGRHSFNRKL
ncbi:diacylglycerol kinase family lipid kinase [Marinilabiliaceae bacterium ANBcel2]|nr:diacylglycerol kinase family lipid kinase [Marinilabiliaceae bacterium ANBcel2]